MFRTFCYSPRVGYDIEVVGEIDRVDAADWDALVGPEDPFMTHGFLSSLERSGSVGPRRSGWQPCHILIREGERLVAAMPLYEKDHSYGEYIFDFGWANGAERAGIPYYPKLVCAVPFTPAGGRRLLVCPDHDELVLMATLVEAARELARARGASSLHVLFCTEHEHALLDELGVHGRLSHQYHWDNSGEWSCFDDFLGALRNSSRKQVRKERKRAQQCGLELSIRNASELSERDWDALWAFYNHTIDRKWGQPYLTRRFFRELSERHPENMYAAMAHEGDEPVAGAMFFWRGHSLYGRYWGATKYNDMLHFELCYYLPMEWGLGRGMRRFEAGAQGQHKIKRGFLPQPTYSAHWVAHPGLANAVQDFLPQEAAQVRYEIGELAKLTPFKREHQD